MTDKVFLDMDGVLADFVGGVCAAHNRPDPYTDPANYNIFEMEKIWGISPTMFWARCDGATFWEDLRPMPDAANIVWAASERFGLANICVLTAPSLSPYCVPGKRKWLKEWFPELKHILFGSSKEFLAHPHSWLIDDRNENVDAFNRAGGNGILVPRPWNHRYHSAAVAALYVREELGAHEWMAK